MPRTRQGIAVVSKKGLKEKNMTEASSCCDAPVKIEGGDGTNYYVCTKCNKPTDLTSQNVTLKVGQSHPLNEDELFEIAFKKWDESHFHRYKWRFGDNKGELKEFVLEVWMPLLRKIAEGKHG